MSEKVVKKEDLRIKRTHKLLRDAMFSLLETNSFDDITVVDICEKAMVHRATFYTHFKDKHDFMEYVAKEKLRDFYKESKLYADFSNKENLYRAMISNVLQFVEDNKMMFRLASQSSDTNFFDSLHHIIYEELLDFLESSQQNGETYRAPVDIFAMYLTGGLTSIVRWWLANDTGYTKADMAKYIESILLSIEKTEF